MTTTIDGSGSADFATPLPVAEGGTGVTTGLVGLGGLVSMQVFTSSGTWTKPTGVTKVKVTVTGGGGGGGSTNSDDMANGGGAGATSIKIIDVTSVASVTVTVGAGKAGNANNTSSSVVYGNPSSFGSYCTAVGGANCGGAWAIGGYGGTASGGDININGGDGQGGAIDMTNTYLAAGSGGSSFWGGGGTGDTRNAYNGRTGRAYGSGGGGGAVTQTGESGADGIIVVEEYA
tara:strand:- start:240 stop:935 length:696 start_codon:yes stop_codon:yes gene_type:complete